MADIRRIEITEDEHVALIRDLPPMTVIRTDFGVRGVRLVVDLDNPATYAPARMLMAMRGISNENRDGAGI